MILFVPAYDDATFANLAVARHLQEVEGPRLLESSATREALLGVLSDSSQPLFAMTHGQPELLRGQSGETALEANDADVAIVRDRPVYAFACHTATKLGARVAQAGGIWWGYTGAIQCPDDGAGQVALELFVEIFTYIIRSFPTASTPEARADVLQRIAQLCEAAHGALDEKAMADPHLDVMPAYYCLLHIWDRLRIWAPGLPEPQQHPLARPPSLFLSPAG